jgi:glycosyltransferase involved in cell wall biosynthesis
MKIAILSPFYPYRGGIAQFSGRLYEALQKEHEVQAFSFSRLYPGFLFPGKTQYVEDGSGVHLIPAERILDSINPFSYQKTVRAIEKFQPDVLIIAYWMSFLVPAYAHVADKLRKKTRIISLLHNAIPHEPHFYDRFLARILFNRSWGFIVMSDIVKNDLLSIKPGARYCLKPHPLYDHYGEKIAPVKARKMLGLDIHKKTLLFFGLIRDYKGLDLLIDALSLLDDSYQLLIAGESYGSFDKYQKQIDYSPAKDCIKIFNHYISDLEVPVLFSAADVLVLPYKSATQSGVIPIAYHFEVPVLATGVGGLKETIEGAGTGVVCSPDAAGLASGVVEIFAAGIENRIANIRKEKETLSWENFAQALCSLLNY